MSGELQVVFIYDTLRCRREEDDPRDAILYFHPMEIPENRRIAICGQLMGITQFLLDMFSAPKILSLENGKFALKELGKQYILALGCSSVTPDWLLEKQADILYQITKFFHKDIDNILTAVGGDRKLLTAKLTSIMDHYIPISQHNGDLFALTFGILPILSLPKSASHISLSATVVLQTCLLKGGVLGGIVMFQNKVIAVELIQDLAKKLAFIQPYQLPDSRPRNKIHAISEEEPSTSQNLVMLIASQNKKIEQKVPIASTKAQNLKSASSPAAAPRSASTKTENSFLPPRLFHSLENLAVHHQTEEDTKPDLKTRCTSLTDPVFPYLRCDGKNISKFYLEAFAYPNPDRSLTEDEEGTLKELVPNFTSKPKTPEPQKNKHSTRRRWSTFEDMMSPVLETPPALEVEAPNNIREKSASISITDTGFLMNTLANPENHDTSFKSTLFNSFRKLSSSENVSDSGRGSGRSQRSNGDNKLNNKRVLSPENQLLRPWAPFKGPHESKKSICTDPEIYEDIVLFIYSLGGMRLKLLLEKSSLNNRELIQTLRDYGSSSIADLEVAVSSVEEQSMSMGGQHDQYCYLHYEPIWHSLAHGGRNHSMDFDAVQHIHQDFRVHPFINELIIRFYLGF
ncbi:Hermansky-Pudlak syndrome 4 protein [Folsomia candida]|uniref:Hermansky-Pudlak syndrome 4 protein n=1 Tax=Folsomia candida TaxID=158441 RepID=A0A226DE31_FOLCA|nr:Hermansky-Pudlak syndrome 4 protein [Folsomia candida]